MMKRRIFTVILCLAGIALIIIGAMTGQAGDVLNRAIRICMECIGLG